MLGSVKLTLPDGTTTLRHCVLHPVLCNGVGVGGSPVAVCVWAMG